MRGGRTLIHVEHPERLGGGRTPDSVDRAVEIEPIAETQLLEIKAEADTPHEAKTLADAYANVFIEYARTRLGATARAAVEEHYSFDAWEPEWRRAIGR